MMKRIDPISRFASAVFLTVFLCVTPAFCQESKQNGTEQAQDGGFVTTGSAGVSGFTHLIVYGPDNGFKPKNAKDYLRIENPLLEGFGIHSGYFRTKVEGETLVAYCLTATPEAYKKMLDALPQLKHLRTERLTKEMFEAYEKTSQESLPNPRMLEIEKSDWYGKLNEKQKKYVQWDENAFDYVYDPKNYEVGSDRKGFEERWAAELDKPEPGYPGGKLVEYDRAIFGLATIKSEKALKPLVKIAAERVLKDNAHRHYATKALGLLGEPAAVPELIPLVYHFNMNTRWDAQIALVRLTGQNFGADYQAWGEWYSANKETLGKDLPKFEPAFVDWSCGSTNAEIQRYCDPAFQKNFDAERF